MSKRQVARFAAPVSVAAMLALVAAGCGSGGGSGSSGSSGSSGNSASKSYGIGCQGPLTGDNAQLGINICDGVKLAVDQANSNGGLPFKLVYKPSDDQGTPDQSPTAARSLIGDNSVVAVVGPAFSGATQAAEPLFTQAGLLSVTASATKPSLTDPSNGFKTFFRAVTNDNAQGLAAADFLTKKLNAKKVYSVDDAEPYGQGLASVLKSSLQSAGATVQSESVPQGTKQYESVAAKVAGAKPDAVYYSGYYADFGPFAKALRAAGFTGTLMSDDGSKDPNYIKLAGASAAEGTYLTCPCTSAANDPKAAAFLSAYKSANNMDPGTYSAEAFDAANAVIATMKKLGSGISRANLVNAFKNVNYQGITKDIAFGPNGELTTKAVFMYQVKNGQIAYLGPINQLLGG